MVIIIAYLKKSFNLNKTKSTSISIQKAYQTQIPKNILERKCDTFSLNISCGDQLAQTLMYIMHCNLIFSEINLVTVSSTNSGKSNSDGKDTFPPWEHFLDFFYFYVFQLSVLRFWPKLLHYLHQKSNFLTLCYSCYYYYYYSWYIDKLKKMKKCYECKLFNYKDVKVKI